VLLVIASRYDQTGAHIVSCWSEQDAVLAIPADLSKPGWQLSLGGAEDATAAVNGEIVPITEFCGVLTRLPGVWAPELTHINAGDREYVAAEMTAFLLAWLSQLTCPLVNPPTAGCLSGPYWRTEGWVATAAGLGIPIHPVSRSSEEYGRQDTAAPAVGANVTVVGGRVLGEVDASLANHARALAEQAGTPLLGVRFSSAAAGASFVGAELWPNLAAEGVAEAILDLFWTP
jgi:hypothetical protein